MAIEVKQTFDLRWPSKVRLPIVLTFEHQSGEGSQLIFGDRPNYMVSDAMQYGARRGIWNILALLEKYQIKATFFVCGTTAERYPDAVRAAQQGGHEIAGMSYSFERVRTASPQRERDIVRRSTQVFEDITGTRLKGWRCPDYRVSPQTLDILADTGFTWDSSLLNDDLPYLFESRGKMLVEIPFTTSTADKTFVGPPNPHRGGPDGLANVWNWEFDTLYDEAERYPRFMILSMQTWIVGHAAPLRMLENFLGRLARIEGLWFARCMEIAQHVSKPAA